MPTSVPPLATGTYTLSVIAPDGIFVNDQLVSACPGAEMFGVIVTAATVAADGGVSIVRPRTAADGTFEMQLVREGHASAVDTCLVLIAMPRMPEAPLDASRASALVYSP